MNSSQNLGLWLNGKEKIELSSYFVLGDTAALCPNSWPSSYIDIDRDIWKWHAGFFWFVLFGFFCFFFFCLLAFKIKSWSINVLFISNTLLYFIFCFLAWLRRKVNVRNVKYLASDFAYENDDPTNGSVIIGFQEGWLTYLEIDLIWSAIGNYILFKGLSLEGCSHINIMH